MDGLTGGHEQCCSEEQLTMDAKTEAQTSDVIGASNNQKRASADSRPQSALSTDTGYQGETGSRENSPPLHEANPKRSALPNVHEPKDSCEMTAGSRGAEVLNLTFDADGAAKTRMNGDVLEKLTGKLPFPPKKMTSESARVGTKQDGAQAQKKRNLDQTMTKLGPSSRGAHSGKFCLMPN